MNTTLPNQRGCYRFHRLSLSAVLKDMYFTQSDPGPGDAVPPFDLELVGGGRFRSADISKTGPLLLVFGSITCPMTDNGAIGLNDLFRIYGMKIKIVMVNVREAHPGKAFPQPETMKEKVFHAEKLKALHGFEFDVAIDDLDGGLHNALGPKPNSAYIIGKEGVILFRAHWANETEALAVALREVSNGETLQFTRSDGLLSPDTDAW